MTSPPLDYRKEAADRLTRASNTFPAHIDRDGVGWIKARQDDVFTILGEREALLADNARMREVLEEREVARSQPGSDAQERSPVPPLSDGGAA